MHFNCIENQKVELRIVNYQFPQIINTEYDSSWLNIYINVESDFGNWKCTDPSLLTFEVQELIDWFISLSNNKKPNYINQEFIEPNLSWNLLNSWDDEIKHIRIKFDLESKPKSAKKGEEYFVDLKASNEELIQIAKDLMSELMKYPQRNYNG